MMRSGILAAIVIFFFIESAWAGGAAVRKQTTNVRAQRHIRLYSEKPRSGDLIPPEEPPKPKAQTPQPVKTESPPKDVLVSSPFYKKPAAGSGTPEVKSADVESDLSRVSALLEQSSEVWPQVDDVRIKAVIVSNYIRRFQQEGVAIRKPPLYYAVMINGLTENEPAILRQPFRDILRTVAIIEYDFNNGQDKDALAASVLGPKAFADNKKRLGLQ
jgi:hypothetical protein